MTIYLESMSGDANWVTTDNARCSAHPEIRPMLKPGIAQNVSIRHLVYSVLPFLVMAGSDLQRAENGFTETITRLEGVFTLPKLRGFDPAGWESLRAMVVKAWFAICH